MLADTKPPVTRTNMHTAEHSAEGKRGAGKLHSRLGQVEQLQLPCMSGEGFFFIFFFFIVVFFFANANTY